MLKKGLIQVYTTESDQPNFAPIGLSLRAAGHGFRILIAGFGYQDLLEELSSASKIFPNLIIEKHHARMPPVPIDPVPEALQRVRERLLKGDFDIVILLEVFQALGRGLITEDNLLSLMDEKPGHVELVLSGQGASRAIIERADLVTEMNYRRQEKNRAKTQNGEEAAPTEVITGNGKGKTTYCLGKALLASSRKTRTLIIQFIKSSKRYGEVKAIERLHMIDLKTMGQGFLDERTKRSDVPDRKHLKAAKLAWEACLKNIFSLKYGLAVLDEINIATYYGLTNAGRVREMIFLKPNHLHLILSGRNADPEVMEEATTVIEMEEIKHPYKKGIKARKGIEF